MVLPFDSGTSPTGNRRIAAAVVRPDRDLKAMEFSPDAPSWPLVDEMAWFDCSRHPTGPTCIRSLVIKAKCDSVSVSMDGQIAAAFAMY